MLKFELPWDSQPQEVVGVDWSNPLTRDLAFVSRSGILDDVSNGLVVYPNGRTRSATTNGVATTLNGTNQYGYVPAGVSVSNSTIFVLVRPESAAQGAVISLGTISGTTRLAIAWANVAGSFNCITDFGATAAVAGTVNAVNAVALVSNGTSRTIFANGTTATGTVSAGIATIERIYLGARINSTPGLFFAGSVLGAMVWRRQLSTSELNEIANNPWQLFAPRSIWVPVSAGGGSATNLTVQDATHSHTADSLTLTVTTSTDLTIADATHAHAADSLTISLGYVDLAIADALHAHAADNLTLSTSGAVNLTIDDATHGHTADSPTVTLGYVDLVIAQALHGHTADSLTLTVSGSVDLLIANALHAHLADTPTPSPGYIDLTIADALHGHTADNLTISFPSDAGVLGSLTGSARPKEPNRENLQTATRQTNSQTATRRNVQTATR